MKEIKKFWNSIAGKVLLIVLVVLVGFSIRYTLERRSEQQKEDAISSALGTRKMDYAEMVADDNRLLQIFQTDFPDYEVILACEEDVTDDGKDDLVVICKTNEGNRTIVMMDSGDSEHYDYSTPIPAPVENQRIQFKNIDKEGEIEFIIMGEKKGAVGYAIYRVIDGEPEDLFGEGMEDCC